MWTWAGSVSQYRVSSPIDESRGISTEGIAFGRRMRLR